MNERIKKDVDRDALPTTMLDDAGSKLLGLRLAGPRPAARETLAAPSGAAGAGGKMLKQLGVSADDVAKYGQPVGVALAERPASAERAAAKKTPLAPAGGKILAKLGLTEEDVAKYGGLASVTNGETK